MSPVADASRALEERARGKLSSPPSLSNLLRGLTGSSGGTGLSIPPAPRETAENSQPDEGGDQADPETPKDHRGDSRDDEDPANPYPDVPCAVVPCGHAALSPISTPRRRGLSLLGQGIACQRSVLLSREKRRCVASGHRGTDYCLDEKRPPLLLSGGTSDRTGSRACIVFGPKDSLRRSGRAGKNRGGQRKERRKMRKKIAAVLLASAFALSVPAAALGAEHHPPKFGVHDTQCSSGSNQPNCPGGH